MSPWTGGGGGGGRGCDLLVGGGFVVPECSPYRKTLAVSIEVSIE